MNTSKSRTRSFCRPRLEALEDRNQPSATPIPGLGDVAFLPAQVAGQLDVVVPAIDGSGPEDPPPAANYATYVTGTTGAGTGTSVALDSTDRQYVAGSITTAFGVVGYIARYQPYGTSRDITFAPSSPIPGLLVFQLASATTTYDTSVNAVAVTPTGNIDVVGGLIDEAGIHEHLAFFAQFDHTGNFLTANVLNLSQTTANPNYFTGIAVDNAGDAVTTGALAGNTILPGGGFVIAEFNPAGTLTAGGVYNLTAPPNRGTAGIGVAVNPAGTTAYIAGFISSNPSRDGLTMSIDLTSPALPLTGFYWVDVSDVTFTGVALKPGTPNQEYFIDTDGVAAGRTSNDVELMDLTRPNPELASYTDVSTTSGAASVTVDRSSGDVFVTGFEVHPISGQVTVEITHLTSSLDPAGVGVTLFGSCHATGTDQAAQGSGVAEDSQGNLIFVGTTTSDDVSTDGTTLNGRSDGFLASFSISSL
jgi:hypothetical protein